MAENKRKMALEAEITNMADKATYGEIYNTGPGEYFKPKTPYEQVPMELTKQRLDAIYDEEPLGSEKDPVTSSAKMLVQDPLEEIDLGDGSTKRITYISTKLDPKLKVRVIGLLRENKDCFSKDYDEMPGLKRELVELKLPIKDGKKPIKQTPRRFAPEILSKIKKEVERLLRCNFIRTTRYVEWIANIVHVIKKNGPLRVCIDFRDLNAATLKDEHPMHVAEMLVDSVAGHEYLSMLDGYSGYNQIFIAEEDAGDFLGFVVHKKGIKINQNKTKAIMETKAPSTKKELQSLLGKINFLRRLISNLSGRTQAFSPLLRLKQGKFEWNDEHQKAFDKIKHYLTNPPILAPPCGKKPMRLYISASDTTIGSMLAQENEDGVERDIYYLSRVLNDEETRYTSIEKLCLFLHFSCTKLKYYIKPIDLYVSSHVDVIKYMLSKPIMHSRIGKWALALIEYSLAFMPLRAMKGQIVSDFIVDHAVVESPQLQVELKPWRLFFDGSTHKDGSGVGIMIISPAGIPTKLKYRSEDIKHVPRIKNQEANDLAQIASGNRISKDKLEELVEVRGKAMAARLSPADLESTQLGYANKEEFEVLAIDTSMDTDWRNPIINYLKDPSIDTGRKTKYRALSYVLMGNEIFKKTPEGILLKCLGEKEAYLALSSVHSGACGAHQAGDKMKWFLFRYGMYWPAMLKDCIEFAKGCQECQVHAGIQHAPARKKPKNWHKTLDQALWACRTSLKEATNTTPFQLAFGHDAVLPVEIYLQSVRIQRKGEIPSDLYWEMMMNELVDLDEERLHALEVLRRQKERVARAYNKRVKGKTFIMNDLVWKVILPMDRKKKTLGKWSPHWEGLFRILKAFSNNAYEIEELAEDRRILKVNGKYLKKYKPFMHEVKIITT
ncbi:uncharacterized protein LOC127095564 [Lathyrus oleraceus]|uniref:uncharacterized protein LOC127095564 n=1 Tax=Pisum sativum TaxID=3888 RepID=UPI0021D20ADE|nr:uncharacterized protein LOC127095564 [Pisum sativum]